MVWTFHICSMICTVSVFKAIMASSVSVFKALIASSVSVFEALMASSVSLSEALMAVTISSSALVFEASMASSVSVFEALMAEMMVSDNLFMSVAEEYRRMSCKAVSICSFCLTIEDICSFCFIKEDSTVCCAAMTNCSAAASRTVILTIFGIVYTLKMVSLKSKNFEVEFLLERGLLHDFSNSHRSGPRSGQRSVKKICDRLKWSCVPASPAKIPVFGDPEPVIHLFPANFSLLFLHNRSLVRQAAFHSGPDFMIRSRSSWPCGLTAIYSVSLGWF
ncbi:hypothetical protein DFS34DRAFT_59151 [Phlyctochytrium arcticum]|nr:hypothetical protein DFS34DRAFT_59151 [Phlyctochytrium arcticum]